MFLDCEIQEERQCTKDQDGNDTDDCWIVPKRVCTKTMETNTKVKMNTFVFKKKIYVKTSVFAQKKVVPRTECNAVPKKVCGPETCPIVKGERRCRDETRHVRFPQFNVLNLFEFEYLKWSFSCSWSKRSPRRSATWCLASSAGTRRPSCHRW